MISRQRPDSPPLQQGAPEAAPFFNLLPSFSIHPIFPKIQPKCPLNLNYGKEDNEDRTRGWGAGEERKALPSQGIICE